MSNDEKLDDRWVAMARDPHIVLFAIWVVLTCLIDGLGLSGFFDRWLFWYLLVGPILIMFTAATWLLTLRRRLNIRSRVAGLVVATVLLESVVLPFLNPFVALPLLFIIGCYMEPRGCL